MAHFTTLLTTTGKQFAYEYVNKAKKTLVGVLAKTEKGRTSCKQC